MGLFDWISGDDKEESPARTLNGPNDLQPGDIVEFEFAAQPQISNRSLTVSRMQTLDTGGDATKRCYVWLAGDDGANVRLLAKESDSLEIAIEILPEQVLAIFAQDDVMNLLDPDTGTMHVLTAITENSKLDESLHGWSGTTYRQEGFVKGYLYDKDYRKRSLPPYSGSGEQGCDYAFLVSDDRNYRLEFLVFDGGRTEVYLATQIPARKIRSYWPKA